jgi:hypothetical protein
LNLYLRKGYTVYCKDKNIWNPSLVVGNYFLGCIKILEKLIEAESGITSYADSIEIDSAKLFVFTEKTLDFFEKTNDTPLLAMISGIVEIVIALNIEIGNSELEITAKNHFLFLKAEKVFYPIEDYINHS